MPCTEIWIIRFRAEPPGENNRGGFVFASWIFNRLAHHSYKIQSQPPRTTTGSLSFGFEYSSDKKHRNIPHMKSFAWRGITLLLAVRINNANNDAMHRNMKLSDSGLNPRENNCGGVVFASWITNRMAHHYYKVQSQPPRTATGSLSSGLAKCFAK